MKTIFKDEENVGVKFYVFINANAFAYFLRAIEVCALFRLWFSKPFALAMPSNEWIRTVRIHTAHQNPILIWIFSISHRMKKKNQTYTIKIHNLSVDCACLRVKTGNI